MFCNHPESQEFTCDTSISSWTELNTELSYINNWSYMNLDTKGIMEITGKINICWWLMANGLQTVSLASCSGFWRPLDFFSRSQHHNKETNKCLTPSRHCMIFFVLQNTPCLLYKGKDWSKRYKQLYTKQLNIRHTNSDWRDHTFVPFPLLMIWTKKTSC